MALQALFSKILKKNYFSRERQKKLDIPECCESVGTHFYGRSYTPVASAGTLEVFRTTESTDSRGIIFKIRKNELFITFPSFLILKKLC